MASLEDDVALSLAISPYLDPFADHQGACDVSCETDDSPSRHGRREMHIEIDNVGEDQRNQRGCCGTPHGPDSPELSYAMK